MTHDLDDLLHHVAGTPSRPTDSAADLARARAGLRRRRQRRFSAGLGGLTAVAVLGVGATAVLTQQDTPASPSQSVAPAPEPVPAAPDGIRLVDQSLEAGPYTFGATPEGWVVENVGRFGVTIVPDDGSVDPDPDVFTGKLVVMFDRNGLGGGPTIEKDGRTFVTRGDSGYTTVSTATLPGEPDGVVRVQFPDDTDWTVDTMVDFLATVQVGDAAQPGLG